MYKFQTILRSGVLSLLAAAIVLLLGWSRADAASYTYTLSTINGFSGSITTSCDNCVLNASNITAWSITVPGVLSIASTATGAKLSVPAGDTDMVATPEGITFTMEGFGAFDFSTPSGELDFAEGLGISSGSNSGEVEACAVGVGCTFLTSIVGPLSVASVSTPFVGSASYAFTGKVTSATGIYASAGATVSGTFTFDLDAGDGALPVSLTAPWSSASTGTSRLVASTLTSGSVTFSDAGSASNKTRVAGLAPTGSSAPNEYFASDTEFSSATNSVQNSLQILGGAGANAPFNSNGLPVFQNATGTGTLLATNGNATAGQLTYAITSLSAAPTTLSVSPASLSFPNTLINTQSAPLTVSITNTSPNDVTISNLAAGPSFPITANSCATVIRAKTSCTLSIAFAPTGSEGLYTDAFAVTDDAQGSPQRVTLTGTETLLPAPVVTLTTPTVDFGNLQVGTTSAARPVTIKNTGNAPLTFFSIALATDPSNVYRTDPFTLLNHCVPTLEPGRQCTVFVSFTPLVAGPVGTSVFISDNIQGSGSAWGQSFGVTGNGTTVSVPGLTFYGTPVNFASQLSGTVSAKKGFDLINTGTAPLKISSIALAGPQASDFILQNACVPTLPPGQHCAVFVTFKPSAAGALEAAVVVTTNPGGVVSVPLYGTATAATAPVLTLRTTSLDFGSQKDGTVSAEQAVDLTNTGTAPLSLSSIAIVGNRGSQAYFKLRNDCVPVLQPGRLCALFVSFNPMAVKGSVFAYLIITDNAQPTQQTVQLFGEGL